MLKAVEMDIRESGALDLPDDVIAESDYVVATIHYGLNQPQSQITERMLNAIASRYVDAIGHPTGRIVGKREGYALDFDAVSKAAAKASCLLEINGSERMDLPDTLAAAARQAGCRLVLSTDAHDPHELQDMRYAVDVARRAAIEAKEAVAQSHEIEIPQSVARRPVRPRDGRPRLLQLDQHTMSGRRVHEGDERTLRTLARRFVDQPDALLAQPFQRLLEIVNAQRDVVNAGTTPAHIPSDRGIIRGCFQQFEGRLTHRDEVRTHAL